MVIDSDKQPAAPGVTPPFCNPPISDTALAAQVPVTAHKSITWEPRGITGGWAQLGLWR